MRSGERRKLDQQHRQLCDGYHIKRGVAGGKVQTATWQSRPRGLAYGGKIMSKQQFENGMIRQEVSDRSKPIELNDQQLEIVAGGKSSPHLFEACTTGKHFSTVGIVIR
jgi:type VI protein secretion system component Hcp